MATILGGLVSQVDGPPSTMSCDPWITCLGDHVTNENRYISTSTSPMATTLARELASDGKMLSRKPHRSLITWTQQVIFQIKNNTCGQ